MLTGMTPAGDGQRWRAVSFAGTSPEGPDAVVTVATPPADDAEATTRLREALAVIAVVVPALLAGISSLAVRPACAPSARSSARRPPSPAATSTPGCRSATWGRRRDGCRWP